MQKEDARPAIDSLVCACVRDNTSHTVWAKVLCYAQKSAEVVCSAERERECCGMLVRVEWYISIATKPCLHYDSSFCIAVISQAQLSAMAVPAT